MSRQTRRQLVSLLPPRVGSVLPRPLVGAIALATLCAACGSDDSSQPPAAARDADFSDSGLSFSHIRGFYDEPFDLEISDPRAEQIAYTLDCSDPRTSPSAITTDLPVTIRVDPEDTTHRYLAPGFIVRAYPLGGENSPIRVSTHTYLFVSRVVELSPDGESPGGDWPQPGATEQVMDYGMDPDVCESDEYSDLIEPALLDLPSVSLCTDLEHLFDPNTGIYMNAREHGREWERPSSLEILNPDEGRGLQINAGVRIRGGFSRNPENPKHAFRLFFREVYGPAKLEFPLFEDEGVSSFDKVDLRTSQNYSWSFRGSEHNTMNRDVFSRDLQRELGRPYTRSRYYQLYLDGYYWGLFQSQERGEARYATSYFGGEVGDWDTVKVDTSSGYVIEATDGNLDAWEEIWNRCGEGFATDAAYYALEGRGPDGERDPTLRVWVDIDNLIDYMLVIFYAGNYDVPASKFFDNERPNNVYALFNRADYSQGFIFLTHDNEHSLFVEPARVGIGLEENRANIGEPGVAMRMVVTEFQYFQPQWLHYRLSDNEKYRQRFARRAQELLEGSAALTGEPGAALFRARAQEIELPIIGESARWGDAQEADAPFTKNDHWTPEVEQIIAEWFPARTEIVIEQLRDVGLYPN